MINKLNIADIAIRIELPNGEAVVLLDRLGKSSEYSKEELARNVLRIDAEGNIVWRVQSEFDAEGNPFTRLHIENGIIAYRWDGGSYQIDLEKGSATPLFLER